MKLERRLTTNCEIRAGDSISGDGKPFGNKITGYAARFGSPSQDLGGFTEIIKPGAFARSLSDGRNITALVDHEYKNILARTDEGTLRLFEDQIGLRFEADLPDTSYARDLKANIDARNVKGMSFGFLPDETVDNWENRDGKVFRELLDIDLIEITATSIPAYEDTSVSMRVSDQTREKAAEMVKPVEVEEEEVEENPEAEEGVQEEEVEAKEIEEEQAVENDIYVYQNELLKIELDDIEF